jgi:hypothetical protein
MQLRHALSFAIGLAILMFIGGIYIGVSYADRVAPVEAPVEVPCVLELEKTGWRFDLETSGDRYRCWLRSEKKGVDIGIWEYGDDIKDAMKTAIQKARRLNQHPECPGAEDE